MPIGTTAAILGSAVIGAGASAISGRSASRAQRDAANQATALQQAQDAEARRQYDQNRADFAPYREVGVTSLNQLATGTRDGGDFNRNFTLADFNADPGAEFRRTEGQRGVEASAAARGGVLSGGALRALARYNSDFASNEYGRAYDRFNNDRTQRFNRLASLAGVGQSATGSSVAAGNNYIDQRQAGVNNISNNIAAAGNARASQYVNTGNAIGGAVNQAGQYFALRDLYKAPKLPYENVLSYGG